MSRYLERAEHIARLVDVNLGLMLEQAQPLSDDRWPRILNAIGVDKSRAAEMGAHTILRWIAFDPANHSSIISAIIDARENARQVREQISSEMWEELNRLFHELRRAALGSNEFEPQSFLEVVKQGSHLFQGITDSTMTHGEGWQFIQLGRYIERASATAQLMDIHFNRYLSFPRRQIEPDDHPEWIGLLKSCTAFEAYCKVYTADLRAERIAEFLLLNDEFPHSVRFAVDNIQNALDSMGSSAARRGTGKLTRLSGRLRAALSYSPMDEILAAGLGTYLENVKKQCTQIHAAIHQVYIDYPIETAIET
jgi:uncharacterized alpha-E superfamily protein